MSYEIARLRAKEENRPVCFMGDLICNKCGESWDIWGAHHGDMTSEEEVIFRAGKGYPCCPKENPAD